MQSKIPDIPCPRHPSEPLKRVHMSQGTENELLCIECLVDNPTAFDKKQLKTVEDFLDMASQYYDSSKVEKGNFQERPDRFQKVVESEHTHLEVLKAKIENEKKRVQKELNSLLTTITQVINKKQNEYCSLLDKQLFNFQYNYQYLEKQL